jgi:Domain of unknown function (DUF4402)
MRQEGKQKKITDWIFILSAIFLLSATVNINAQEPPPRPIRINSTAQILSFGAFYHGASGGTVIIEPSGARSSTGDVVLLSLGYSYSAALFEVRASRGTVISILKGPDVMLTGIPSGSMSLRIGNTNPTSPFVSNVNFNIIIPLYVGGTLTVGNSAANPPGTYTGSFYITLVRE